SSGNFGGARGGTGAASTGDGGGGGAGLSGGFASGGATATTGGGSGPVVGGDCTLSLRGPRVSHSQPTRIAQAAAAAPPNASQGARRRAGRPGDTTTRPSDVATAGMLGADRTPLALTTSAASFLISSSPGSGPSRGASRPHSPSR